ncbi:MAG: HAMP domain-containing protein [Aeriscardovia sp.]|nr:HAMP domain-containing protein [Aeriscardovia sp.]
MGLLIAFSVDYSRYSGGYLMFRRLKIQLLLSASAALLLLILGIYFIARGWPVPGVLVMLLLCAYLVLLNLWFWRYVSDPIRDMTQTARRIAEGSYGTKIEQSYDNEIGDLAREINGMSEKVAVAEKARTEKKLAFNHPPTRFPNRTEQTYPKKELTA